jgi:hypothetical protein
VFLLDKLLCSLGTKAEGKSNGCHFSFFLGTFSRRMGQSQNLINIQNAQIFGRPQGCTNCTMDLLKVNISEQ